MNIDSLASIDLSQNHPYYIIISLKVYNVMYFLKPKVVPHMLFTTLKDLLMSPLISRKCRMTFPS